MPRTALLVALCLFHVGFLATTTAANRTQIHLKETREKSIEITADFETPHFRVSRDGTSIAQMSGLLPSMQAGLPAIPIKPVRLALPAGTTVDSIEITEGSHRLFQLKPATSTGMMPMSWRKNPPRVFKLSSPPDYRGNQFPAARADYQLQKLHGTPIALVNLYPLVALRSGGMDFVDSLRVKLHLKESGDPVKPLRQHQRMEVQKFVDNYDAVTSYPSQQDSFYDYLIITTPAVLNYQGPNDLSIFQKSLLERGLSSKVTNVTDIDSQTTGEDRIEKIRNYIRKEYQTNGIRYVMLIGKSKSSSSEAYLPSRPMHAKVKAYFGGEQWVDIAEKIPADHYYAALDGGFNTNGNTLWGEPNDGENGGDVDFLPEIAIGRVVIDNTSQLQQFVKKTRWVDVNKLSKNMLLAGELLFQEMNLYGDEYMEQLIGECSDHLFETSGYPNHFSFQKLYDRKATWTASEAMTALNGVEFGMVNHLGHSNYNYNLRMDSSSISKIKNLNPFFYYSQGCFAGQFTKGSFIDQLVSAQNGAFAAVGNSTYGLAPEDPQFDSTKTPGGSQMLHRQFIHALFTKGISEFGVAHQESKRAFIDLKAAMEIRWVTWAATFFGDPSAKLQIAN